MLGRCGHEECGVDGVLDEARQQAVKNCLGAGLELVERRGILALLDDLVDNEEE